MRWRHHERCGPGPPISNSNITPLFVEMAQNLNVGCFFGPSTLSAWGQNTSPYTQGCGLSWTITNYELWIKKFTPHCVCRPSSSGACPIRTSWACRRRGACFERCVAICIYIYIYIYIYCLFWAWCSHAVLGMTRHAVVSPPGAWF